MTKTWQHNLAPGTCIEVERHPCPPVGGRQRPRQQCAMWVTSAPIKPETQCAAAMRCFYRFAQPTLRTMGQCMFGLAMLFIIAGIALCIWGYVGTAIVQFQILGPVCIGLGVLIYAVGCILCCREYPAFERTLQTKAKQEKTRRAIELLADKEVIEWLQGEPDLYQQFKVVSDAILQQHGLFTGGASSGNVIANLYVNRLCPDS